MSNPSQDQLSAWLNAKNKNTAEALARRAATEPLTPREAKRLKDDRLHERIGKEPDPSVKSVLEAELRRREAWRGPAGKAIWISLAALAISIAALIVGIVLAVSKNSN